MTTFTSDLDIAAALSELLSDTQNLLTSAQAQKPIDKQEVAYWQRQVNALNKADFHWQSGVRPVRSSDAWLIPSASRPGSLIHRLVRHGGVLVCSCEASQHGRLCFHHMLVNVIERAMELAALANKHDEDGGDDEDLRAAIIAERITATDQFLAAARARLGRRLTEARSRYDYAA